MIGNVVDKVAIMCCELVHCYDSIAWSFRLLSAYLDDFYQHKAMHKCGICCWKVYVSHDLALYQNGL